MSLTLLKVAIVTLSLSHTTHGLDLTNETLLQSQSEVSTDAALNEVPLNLVQTDSDLC